MYLPPKSLLSRLLGAAWTILLITGVLWVSVRLLREIWIWLVVIAIVVVLIWIVVWILIWVRRLRQDLW